MGLGLVVAGIGRLVASMVWTKVLGREVAYGPMFFAYLNLTSRAKVPCLVEGRVVPFGHRAQDPAGEGDVLPFRTHVQRIRGGDLEGRCQICSEKGKPMSPS